MRFQKLAELGREDLSLARLVEAHFDAIAILSEAGIVQRPGVLYAVWASESPKSPLALTSDGRSFKLNGSKAFCSGASLVDRALVTAGLPQNQLIDVDLTRNHGQIEFDYSAWKTEAFAGTKTATATFRDCVVEQTDLVGCPRWYLDRTGFWNGAIAPAACWAGGAFGLIDYALNQTRSDPHTLAHLGALLSSGWALGSYLKTAGDKIDTEPVTLEATKRRALVVRHLVEQACSDVLQKLGRAYGPHPLAMDKEVSMRCQELNLYLRQDHAERDLAVIGLDAVRDRTGLSLKFA